MSIIVYVRPQDGEVCNCCLARSFCIIENNEKPVIFIVIVPVAEEEVEEAILLKQSITGPAMPLPVCVDSQASSIAPIGCLVENGH